MEFPKLILPLVILAAFAAFAGAISSCQALNSADTTYTLTDNVTLSNNPCFPISASGVTLDCDGFWITGGGTSGNNVGVSVSAGGDNSVIKNCLFSNENDAIYLASGADGITVYNNTVHQPIGDSAIEISSSSNNNISSNNLRSVPYGIWAGACTNCTVSSNDIRSVSYSISAACTNCTMEHNSIYDCVDPDQYAFDLGGTQGSNVSSNTIYNCSNGIWVEDTCVGVGMNRIASNNITINPPDHFVDGIYVRCASNSSIISNSISTLGSCGNDCYLRGLYLSQSSYATVFSNTLQDVYNGVDVSSSVAPNITSNNVTNAHYYGIALSTSNYYAVSSNRIRNAVRVGIQIQNCQNGTVANNDVSGVSGYADASGISLEYADGATVNYNRVSNTTEYGMYLDTSDKLSVTGNNISDTTYGITVGVNSTFVLNELNDTTYAFDVVGSNSNITGNTVSATQYGVYFRSFVQNTTVSSNSISADDYGVYFVDNTALNNNILDNTVSGTAEQVFSQSPIHWSYKSGASEISFTSVVVNSSTSGKLYIGTGVVAVNVSAVPTLNSSARITMPFSGTCPNVHLYYAPDYYTSLSDIISNGQLCDGTTAPKCTLVSCSGSTVVFDVEHFDTYGGEGFDVPEFSALTALAALLLAAGGYAVAKRRR